MTVNTSTNSQTHDRGSLPPELEEALREIENVFTVDKDKLQQIIVRFEEELTEGLEGNGKEGNIPMNPTWVMGWPTGAETGSYLALDLGGTNLRVCWITLNGRGSQPDMIQDSYKLSPEIRSGSADELWSMVAGKLQDFIEKHQLGGTAEDSLPFAFTFSYPATQDCIDQGILQRWTKGLDIKGVEGHDVAAQVREAIEKRNLPIKLVALVNDTTGAMISSYYNDPDTIIGCIFGTGCNAAYMEHCSAIPKLPEGVPKDREMAINCEYGAFDNSCRVLPRTKYDLEIDEQSPRPGQQRFEKLSAGHYLGEIFRLALLDLHEQQLIFKDHAAEHLRRPYVMDTGFLSAVEDDDSPDLAHTRKLYKEKLDLDVTRSELTVSRRLAVAIATRGARLCTTGVAAICKKQGLTSGHVAADGSVANKHPKFKKRWSDAMAEVMDWPADRDEDPIVITSAEDGSGIGAAVIAAMTLDRRGRGDDVGLSRVLSQGI
ncbi:Hexokinase [Lecanosticta acicola]|uniref:Phosphotransferase n=1 Tax=Lecanosticta acicola TaxID=111012 RepID=A0AAI9EC20_9PEZI|nr:Hexokinase [Lecanosticta acicola]